MIEMWRKKCLVSDNVFVTLQIYMGGSQLVLSNTNRIGDIKYNI
jgi:hypothetical protein